MWVTETCQTALTEKSKKSQSLRRHTRAQILCGICYKRFELKHVASDIKEEKLGQFSIWCGSKQDSFFFLFFWQERRAGFVSVTPMMNSWENSPSRPVWTSSILQRTWAIGCWIYITNPRELSQEVKVWQMIKPAHLFKYYMKHQYIIEQIAGDGQDICLKEHSAETKNILLTIVYQTCLESW